MAITFNKDILKEEKKEESHSTNHIRSMLDDTVIMEKMAHLLY